MSPQRKAIAFWLAVGAVGFLAIPWYALQDSILSGAWLRNYSARENAPALLQGLRHGRVWLLAIGAMLLLAAPLLRARHRAQISRARPARSSAPPGSSFSPPRASPSARKAGRSIRSPGYSGRLPTGQYGMGWGATLAATSFAMLFALGLAESGHFNGDAFIASSVVAIALSVAIFTFFPVVTILASAFEDGNGAISATAFFNRLFTAKIWNLACLSGGGRCGVAWNTLLLALLCAAGCTALGLAFALIVTRTSFRYKRMLRALSVLPIITPPFVIGLGLILMFGRAGIVNQWLEWAFGIEPSRWIYGLPGLLLAQIFSFTPIAFLVLIGVVEGVSPSIEEAAQTLRANRWRTFVDVSLPLMRPGLANAFLISFIESIADFGNPIVLGGNFGVLATEVFFSVVGAQLDQGRAATLGILLLLFALAAFFAQRRVLGRKVYTALAGKGDAGLPTPLPDRRAPRLLRRGAALGGADDGDLRDGDARRLRRAMGPQLHADAEALCEGVLDRMGQPRHPLVRHRVELVLDHGRALGDRRADHRGARHPDRVHPDPAPLRRPVGLRVRHHAVVRDSRHGDRRVVHPRLQRPADRDHRHRAGADRLQRVPQHAGRRARRHRLDGADRQEPRRGVDDAGRARRDDAASACCCRCSSRRSSRRSCTASFAR